MGFLDAGYALFEYTGQRLLDFYDIISSAPAIVKIFQNNNTKKNRRKEKGLAGRFLTPKRGITKSSKSHKHSKRDSHILVTPRTPKLSLASTPSIKSTPTQPVPIPISAPTPAPEKIQKLESELTKLREEIAKLMQQPKAGSQQAGGVSGTVSFASQTPTPQSFVPPTPSSTSAGAPPPPPPPPPPAPPAESTPKLVRSVSTIEQGATPSTPKKEMQKSMSLADVLKGASAANLRKTDLSRSPGGTPLDTPKGGSQRLNDPQDFIAQALKKKFASINNKFNTPETSQKRKQVDGDSGWDESPPPSPGRNRKYTPIAFVQVQDENVPPVENVRA